MAESQGGEASDESVRPRVRLVSKCGLHRKIQENIQRWNAEIEHILLKIKTADKGRCTVDNSKQQSMAEIRELCQDFKLTVEELVTNYISHMELCHPRFGTGRAAADSGYCGSRSGSEVLSTGQLGTLEPPPNPTHAEQPRALTTNCLRGPILEEEDCTNC